MQAFNTRSYLCLLIILKRLLCISNSLNQTKNCRVLLWPTLFCGIKQPSYRVHIDTIGSALLGEYSSTILLPFSESVPLLSLPLQNTTGKNIEKHWSTAIEHAHLETKGGEEANEEKYRDSQQCRRMEISRNCPLMEKKLNQMDTK